MAKTRVLIIDDEPLLVKSTSMALSYRGFEAAGASDGEEGLRAAGEFRPDVILLDIMLPGMDGWEVLEKLKASEILRDIPVIIFTAKEYWNGKRIAAEKGADDFCAKPFEIEHLIGLLNTHAVKR